MRPTDVEQIAREAIGLMIEYRDVHDYAEGDATANAIRDVIEGWDAKQVQLAAAAAAMGAVRSRAKGDASRANGRKGGRPKKGPSAG